MKSRPSLAAVAALLIAVLAGCEEVGTDPVVRTSTTPLTAEPADGTVISNDDFSYTAPAGWEESEQVSAASLAVDVRDSDGFVDNINVVTDHSIVGLDPAELEDAAKQVLADASATQIRAQAPVQIDGEEAVHIRAYFELSVPKHRVEQYAVVRDDTGYIVTLSFSPDVPAAERDEISESILATWKWDS